METQIVLLGSSQARLLDNLAPDVFDGEIDPVRLAAYLAEPSHKMVVAVSDRVIVGQARGAVQRRPDLPTELYVENLGVTPSRQREGIAMRLLDALVDWARVQGCEAVWVTTEVDNEPARALYQRRGSDAEPSVVYAYALDAT